MAPHLLAHSLYVQNLRFGAFLGAVNTVDWSLEIEIQFYILVPLLSIMLAIGDARLRRTVILLAMLLVGILSIPLYRTTHLHYSIFYYCAFFLAGFLLCDLYLTRGEWRRSFVWDALAICLWPIVWIIGRILGHVDLPFLIVVLYLSAFRGRICSALFSRPAITGIGGMCYSIYLFHFPGCVRCEAPDHAAPHRRQLFVLFHPAVLPDRARYLDFWWNLFCHDRTSLLAAINWLLSFNAGSSQT